MDNVNQSSGQPLELIHTVMHLVRSQQHQVLRDGAHDITHMESKVLGYFNRNPGATQSDLANDTGRDKAQLARLIKGLRDRDLLAAQVDEVDRRNIRLAPTTQGSAVLGALRQASDHVAVRAMAGLTAEEQAQLVTLLRRVQQNLRTG